MAARERTQQELEQKLFIQLRQLAKRCDDYTEEGHFFEAYATATIVRVLVHDTANSTSLLELMGVKSRTRFLDSRVHGNLYLMGVANGYGGLHPRTRMPYRQYSRQDLYPFDEWWERQEFLVFGERFTRRQLVSALANKEGGAHVDPHPHAAIDRINHRLSPYTAIEADKERRLYGAELASMCAIGEEVLFSLMPEPENRKRMLHEEWQKPYYLDEDAIASARAALRADIDVLNGLLDAYEEGTARTCIHIAIANLQKTLDLPSLTSEDLTVRRGIATTLAVGGVRWKGGGSNSS